MQTLHIPKRIRFQCSGCGNCCLQWPVPLTEQDVDRIRGLVDDQQPEVLVASEVESELRKILGKPSGPGFRTLNPGDQRFRGFSHTLEKREDGRCRFLQEDNRCFLHVQFGADSKPSMCSLFPHAFSETPSGVYAYLSFASSAVLFNHGMLLTDQEDLLAQKYRLYRQLFPRVSPDWSKLQILDGHPLVWQSYTQIETLLIEALENPAATNVLDKLEQLSRIVVDHLPKDADCEKLPPMEARPQVVDQILLKHLYAAYMPNNVFEEDDFDIDTRSLMTDIVQAPQSVSLCDVSMAELCKCELPSLDDNCQDLFNRFVYARVFAKLYLGPSLGHFSMLAGIHHLFYIIAIAHLHLKRLKLQGATIDLLAAAETIRTIERRLTQMNYSQQTSAILEVLMSSPSRLARIRKLLN